MFNEYMCGKCGHEWNQEMVGVQTDDCPKCGHEELPVNSSDDSSDDD